MSNLFPSNILEEAVKCVIYFPLGIEIAANNVTKMSNFWNKCAKNRAQQCSISWTNVTFLGADVTFLN